MIMGSLNVATDVTTLCLPMPLLWSLKISVERRLQVMSMFLLGGLYVLVKVLMMIIVVTNLKTCIVYALSARIVFPKSVPFLYRMQLVCHAQSLGSRQRSRN